MKVPASANNEHKRLQTLESLGVLYTPAEERFDRITRLARRIFGVPIALIPLVTEKTLWFKSAQGITLWETPRETSFCGHTILRNDTLVITDTLLDPDFADNPLVTGTPYVRFYAGHPISHDNEHIGTLCIIDQQPRQFSDDDLYTLQSLAAWVENELNVSALSESQKKLLLERDEAQRRTLVDPLTKLWNRTGMEYLLLREFSAAQRKRGDVVLMLLDIDRFALLVSKHGEAAGETVLKEIAARVRALVRPHDLMVRYGKDQFLLYAEDCPADTGVDLAERMLARVNAQKINHDKKYISASLSIGLAAAKAREGVTIPGLIKAAGAALQEAQAAGRNCARSRQLG